MWCVNHVIVAQIMNEHIAQKWSTLYEGQGLSAETKAIQKGRGLPPGWQQIGFADVLALASKRSKLYATVRSRRRYQKRGR